MKKILRIFAVIISFFIVILIGVFFYFFNNKIVIDSQIKKDLAIKNLNHKILFSFYDNPKEKSVTTDFYFDEKLQNDTVFYQCRFEETGILNTKIISFVSGDGFSGLKINITKFGNFFRTDIENYTDNLNDTNLTKYNVKKQTLTLDKNNYKKGDSIYGKINLKVIKESQNGNEEYESFGYFKTKL